jgi:hypothetical protein
MRSSSSSGRCGIASAGRVKLGHCGYEAYVMKLGRKILAIESTDEESFQVKLRFVRDGRLTVDLTEQRLPPRA